MKDESKDTNASIRNPLPGKKSYAPDPRPVKKPKKERGK